MQLRTHNKFIGKDKMSRQYCVLFYGKNEPYSRQLFRYINQQPFDFFGVTGLAKVCVNKPDIKHALLENNIKEVPCILIKYYNQRQDYLIKNDIYNWIDDMAHRYDPNEQVTQLPELPGSISQVSSPTDTITTTKVTSVDTSIMDAAKNLQKLREDAVGIDDGKSVRLPQENGAPSQ